MFGYLRMICLIFALAVLCVGMLHAEELFRGDESIPNDAIVLFNGKDLSWWVSCDGKSPANWKVENGYMIAGGGDICSKQLFKDCQLHVEFWVPLMKEARGQGRGNSGVFLQGWNYEVQILDSYGLTPGAGDCGAIYSIAPPMVNACRPPEHWQTFDIFFHAARFDEKGNKIENARMSVIQNGVWIHENVEIPRPTPSASMSDPKEAGPIRLQDHGCPVRFRNIWVRPLKTEDNKQITSG
ncbi:MAG: 3-keto-disaccharide hydrolase [Armatimonadota bacterium]